MPNAPDEQRPIELATHEYWRKDPRTGRMVRDLKPAIARNWMFVALVLFALGLWVRRDVAPTKLFPGLVITGAAVGIMAWNWLRFSPRFAWTNSIPKFRAGLLTVFWAICLRVAWEFVNTAPVDQLLWWTAGIAALFGVSAAIWTRDIY